MAYYMEAIDTERESLNRQFRATAKRREQERRESRAVKLDMRVAWTMEESESC